MKADDSGLIVKGCQLLVQALKEVQGCGILIITNYYSFYYYELLKWKI